MILFEFTRSWFTPTLLSETYLETQYLPCCVAFFPYRSWSPAKFLLPDSTRRTISNVQFLRLLRKLFHSLQLDLKDSWSEKVPFFFLRSYSTRSDVSNSVWCSLAIKRECHIVASIEVDLSYYSAVCTQRGRGHGALALVFGRTAIHSLKDYFVRPVDASEKTCWSSQQLNPPCCQLIEKHQISCQLGGETNFQKTAWL